MLLFLLCNYEKYKIISAGTYETGILDAGYYKIECAGGKGGDSDVRTIYGKNYNFKGGSGSKGYIKIKVDYQISYEVMAGKQGITGSHANGGWPDGGKSGQYEKRGLSNYVNKAGSGGGSSRFYINRDPALVCAGGSGAYYDKNGSSGGGYGYNYINDGSDQLKFYNHEKSMKSYKGGDGAADVIPYAGGGGGYFGGIGGNSKSENAASGESYVNTKFVYEKLVYEYQIFDGTQDGNHGDGFVRIYTEVSCPKNCAVCDKNGQCLACKPSAPILIKNECTTNAVVIENCKKGQYQDFNGVCHSCSDDCEECKWYNICTKCKDNRKSLNKLGQCQITPPNNTQKFKDYLKYHLRRR